MGHHHRSPPRRLRQRGHQGPSSAPDLHLTPQNRDDSGAYRIPIAIQFAWALILSGGLLLLPESPRFLIKKGRDAAARRSLARLLKVDETSPLVEQEYQEIYQALQAELAIGATSYLDCFKSNSGKNLLRVQTGIWLQAMQQLTGINFIFYYGTTFFQQSGIQNPFLITIATNGPFLARLIVLTLAQS